MANVPLKSIKFPGLSDTYQVPQIDNTLAAAGKAAESAVTGGMLSNLDNRVNALHQLVNYGYDVPYSGTATGGSSGNAYSLDITRMGTMLKINGNCGTSSTGIRIQLNTAEMKAGTATASLGGGFQLTDGHKYRLRQHIISGTATVAPQPVWTLPTNVTKIGNDNPVTDANGDLYAEITYDASTYTNGLRMICFLARTAGNTVNNLVVQYTVEDVTAAEAAPLAARVLALEAKLDYLELDEQIDLSGMEG